MNDAHPMIFGGSLTMLLGILGVACGPSQPPPEPPPPSPAEPEEPPLEDLEPEPEALETGKDCAKAVAVCDGGICKATVTNDCPEPVTCELTMSVLCKDTTETGEAKGRNRGTIPAGKQDVIEAAGNCEGAMMVATTPDGLSCR